MLLLHFPYRLLYHAEFDAVEWRGRRCYVLGEREAENTCCSARAWSRRATELSAKDGGEAAQPVGTKMNPFEHASISPTERP